MGSWTPPPVMKLDQPDPPVYHSPLDSRAKLMNLQNLALQQQEGQQNLQIGQMTMDEKRRALAQTQAVNEAYKNAWTLGPDGTLQLDKGKFTKTLVDAGQGSAVTGYLEGHTKLEKSLADLGKVKGEIAAAEQNAAGDFGAMVKSGNNDPDLFINLGTQAVHSGAVAPEHLKPLIDNITAAKAADPTGEKARALVGQYADMMIAGSPKQQELQTARRTSDATVLRNKAQAGEADVKTLQGQMQIGAQTMPVPDPQTGAIDPQAWTEWRAGLQPAVQAKVPPKPSPAAVAIVKQMGVTPDQQRQGEQAATQTDVADLEINGKPHKVLVNKRTGEVVQDLGESGIKPPQVNVNASAGLLDRESARFAKPHEKAVADANAQLEKINDARAMINGSAEAQALGIPKVLTALVSGAGSGVRITQPELNAIAKARGITGDVVGFFNGISGKGKLTAEQQRQLTQLMDDVADRIRQKQGIANDALDRINSARSRDEIVRIDSEARQKLGESVGGPTGAKPAAGGAGHSIKIGNKFYRYNGSGDTGDLKNYTEVKQ